MSDLDSKLEELKELTGDDYTFSRECFALNFCIVCAEAMGEKELWRVNCVDDLVTDKALEGRRKSEKEYPALFRGFGSSTVYEGFVDRTIVERALEAFKLGKLPMYVGMRGLVVPLLEKFLGIGEDAWSSTYENLDLMLEVHRGKEADPLVSQEEAKRLIEELNSEGIATDGG